MGISIRDYSNLNKVGRQMAEDLISDISAGRSAPPAFGYAIREMVRASEFGGVEIGFCQRIAEAFVASAPAEQPATPPPARLRELRDLIDADFAATGESYLSDHVTASEMDWFTSEMLRSRQIIGSILSQ
jgi:hypothetical protein